MTDGEREFLRVLQEAGEDIQVAALRIVCDAARRDFRRAMER